MMNILYISSKKRWGGVVSWMQKTSLGLEKKGHQVWIISHPDSRLTKSHPQGIKIIPKKFGMDYNPAMILFLYRFIKKNKIDLVVTNIEKEIIVGGIVARICKIPNICRIGLTNDLNNRLKVKLHRKLLVDGNIVPCDDIKNNLSKKYKWLNSKKFVTIYNGRNTKEYSTNDIVQQRKQWRVSEQDMIIGTTSQLTKIKRIDNIIEVFKKISGEYKKCYLIITGEGPERENLQDMTKKLNISGRVIFAGFSSEPMKSAAAYDIAILNSKVERFPNNLVEYLAVGTPVVSTAINGVIEIIEDGKNGLLISPEDNKQLLENILLLIESSDLRKRLSRNALASIKKGFTEDKMINKLERLFLETLNLNREKNVFLH